MLYEAKAAGLPTPALDERPILDVVQQYYLEAYYQLSSSRNYSTEGPLGIPVSEVWAYCNMSGVSNLEEKSTLLKFILRVDGRYLEHIANKRKALPKGKD